MRFLVLLLILATAGCGKGEEKNRNRAVAISKKFCENHGGIHKIEFSTIDKDRFSTHCKDKTQFDTQYNAWVEGVD